MAYIQTCLENHVYIHLQYKHFLGNKQKFYVSLLSHFALHKLTLLKSMAPP